MDPITVAIIASLSEGVVGSLSETSKTPIADTYAMLKDLIIKKFGAKSSVMLFINQLEVKPESAGRQETLHEEIIAVKADHDPDLLQAAAALLHLLQASSEGKQHIQHVIGNYNASAQGSGSASININPPKKYDPPPGQPPDIPLPPKPKPK